MSHIFSKKKWLADTEFQLQYVSREMTNTSYMLALIVVVTSPSFDQNYTLLKFFVLSYQIGHCLKIIMDYPSDFSYVVYFLA